MAADAGQRLVARRAAPRPRQPLRRYLRHRLGAGRAPARSCCRSSAARWPRCSTAGELTVARTGGPPSCATSTNAFPLCDGSAEGRGSLANLLARQHYRLAWWRSGRRPHQLAALLRHQRARLPAHGDEPEAFEAVHALPLRLYAEGMIDGVRIDHVDGLADPAGYCRKLRQRLDRWRSARPVARLARRREDPAARRDAAGATGAATAPPATTSWTR